VHSLYTFWIVFLYYLVTLSDAPQLLYAALLVKENRLRAHLNALHCACLLGPQLSLVEKLI